MDNNIYLAAARFFSRRKGLLKFLSALQKTMERAIYILYPAFLIYLIFDKNGFWWRSAAVCFLSLCVVSLVRAKLNLKRPYEKYGFDPLIERGKGGKAFPSRHAFSGAIISLHIGLVFPAIGIAAGIMTLAIALLRVIFGIHFVRDVLAGIFCGIGLGLLVFLL